MVIADYFTLSPNDIENADDECFMIEKQKVWILTKEEVLKKVQECVGTKLKIFDLSMVEKSIDVPHNDIKEFFIAEILADEIYLDYNRIDVEWLKKYIESKCDFDTFIEKFSTLIFEQRKSGILWQAETQVEHDGFYIYYR